MLFLDGWLDGIVWPTWTDEGAPFVFQEERISLSEELSRVTMASPAGPRVKMEPASVGSSPNLAEGSSPMTEDALKPPSSRASADRSQTMGRQFYAEGGKTDGCYALYGADQLEQTADQLLQLLKVRGSEWGSEGFYEQLWDGEGEGGQQ